MSGHTPGPWKAYDSAMPQFFVTAEGKDICKVSTSDVSLLEAKDNANLIAAAPDLLEALETIKRRMYEPRQFMLEEVEAIVDIAIARAKGEE